jgi:hypothetical protein
VPAWGEQGRHRRPLELFLTKSEIEKKIGSIPNINTKKIIQKKLFYNEYLGIFIKINLKCLKRKSVTTFSGCRPIENYPPPFKKNPDCSHVQK